MNRKTGSTWKTDKCGRCGESHSGYSGKLDAKNIEYVVCGITNKRMNVSPTVVDYFVFRTKWEKECLNN